MGKLEGLLAAEYYRLSKRGVWFSVDRMVEHCEYRPEFIDYSVNDIRSVYTTLLASRGYA